MNNGFLHTFQSSYNRNNLNNVMINSHARCDKYVIIFIINYLNTLSERTYYNETYDYGSIVHYNADSFINDQIATIIPIVS